MAQRARIVLLAADGVANAEIAELTGTSRPTVNLWRGRYVEYGIGGLDDAERSGRPRTVSHADIVAATGVPPPKRLGVTLVEPAVGRSARDQCLDGLACLACLRGPAVAGAYAAVFAYKPGARLAPHVAVGYVGQVSESGRVALADVYRLIQAALTVELGLDTNTFVDRVTGRHDPRQDHASGSAAFLGAQRAPTG